MSTALTVAIQYGSILGFIMWVGSKLPRTTYDKRAKYEAYWRNYGKKTR